MQLSRLHLLEMSGCLALHSIFDHESCYLLYQVLLPVEVTSALEDEILIIRFNEVLPLGEGTLVIAFQGTLNDKMKGFYRR